MSTSMQKKPTEDSSDRRINRSKWGMIDSLSSTNLGCFIPSEQEGMEERVSVGSYEQPKGVMLFESNIPAKKEEPRTPPEEDEY